VSLKQNITRVETLFETKFPRGRINYNWRKLTTCNSQIIMRIIVKADLLRDSNTALLAFINPSKAACRKQCHPTPSRRAARRRTEPLHNWSEPTWPVSRHANYNIVYRAVALCMRYVQTEGELFLSFEQ